MKITDNEYIKLHTEFCNKLGSYVIKTDNNRDEYKLAKEYLAKTLELALKNDTVASIMSEYLSYVIVPLDGIGTHVMPMFFEFDYTLKEYKIINNLIREINFNIVFS